MTPKIAGAILLAIPLVVIAWALLWRRNRPILWFALALIAMAIGYLMATGATDDIALSVMPQLGSSVPVKAK